MFGRGSRAFLGSLFRRKRACSISGSPHFLSKKVCPGRRAAMAANIGSCAYKSNAPNGYTVLQGTKL